MEEEPVPLEFEACESDGPKASSVDITASAASAVRGEVIVHCKPKLARRLGSPDHVLKCFPPEVGRPFGRAGYIGGESNKATADHVERSSARGSASVSDSMSTKHSYGAQVRGSG